MPDPQSIKVHRAIRGLSQEQLALQAGISRNSLVAIENGSNPRIFTLQKIAKALDVTLDDIIITPKK
jgi:DNA-binding XRE family transcriptional regulator